MKADGSVSIHADDRAYKPLNWMSPPCTLRVGTGDEAGLWTVTNKAGERLVITVEEVLHDSQPRARRGPRPGQGRGRGAPAGPAGRPDRDPRQRLAAGPAGVPDRDRPGRHPGPGRRRRDRGDRDQAARRDRRGRAADPLPRAAQPRLHAARRSAACSPPRRSSRRPGCSPPTAASTASPSTTTPCAASTTPTPASSDSPPSPVDHVWQACAVPRQASAPGRYRYASQGSGSSAGGWRPPPIPTIMAGCGSWSWEPGWSGSPARSGWPRPATRRTCWPGTCRTRPPPRSRPPSGTPTARSPRTGSRPGRRAPTRC